jgi:hypothetical protein
VRVEPDAVTRPVHERLPETGLLEHRPGGGIDVPGGRTRAHGRDTRLLRRRRAAYAVREPVRDGEPTA